MSLVLAIEAFSSIVSAGASALMVEVDVERPLSVFFKGPRWVSLNSARGSGLAPNNLDKLTFGQIPGHDVRQETAFSMKVDQSPVRGWEKG